MKLKIDSVSAAAMGPHLRKGINFNLNISSNYTHYTVWDEYLIQSQTSAVQLLKFG